MKKLLFVLICILLLACKSKQDFSNRQIQEKLSMINTDNESDNIKRNWAYNIYKGDINTIADSNSLTIQYPGNFKVILYNYDVRFEPLFKKGILYPQLFGCAIQDTCLIVFGNICCFKEVRKSGKTRWYSFWVFHYRWMNPTDYTLQIENKNGTDEMTIEEFTNGVSAQYLTNNGVIL